jgi:hypothetical protein
VGAALYEGGVMLRFAVSMQLGLRLVRSVIVTILPAAPPETSSVQVKELPQVMLLGEKSGPWAGRFR